MPVNHLLNITIHIILIIIVRYLVRKESKTMSLRDWALVDYWLEWEVISLKVIH